MSLLDLKWTRRAVLPAMFLALAAAPFGCSKGGEQAQQPQGQQQAAPAPAADPGKEHFEKGVQFSLKGQFDEAIKEYEETLKYNPKSAETHNNLGFAYFDKGNLDKAIEHQKKALEINPNLANGFYGLAMAEEAKGNKPEAIRNWKEFMKLSQPHSKWWMKAQEHIAALEGKGQQKKGEGKKKN